MPEPDLDHELIRRRDAAQATLDHWRMYKWRMGEADCLRMVAWHLRLLGYKVRLPARGAYRTTKTALKLLGQLGHADLPAAIDSIGLEQIAPASAIVGDIVELPSEDDRLPALTVALGNGRVVGWHDDMPTAGVLQPVQYARAWRAAPVAGATGRRAPK